jgi:signal peptidase II
VTSGEPEASSEAAVGGPDVTSGEPEASSEAAAGGPSITVPLLIAAIVVVVDQLSKQWALSTLDDGRTIDIVGSLRFNLAFNKGMAFSQGTGFGPVIGVVALLVVVGLLVSIGRSTSRVYPLAVGLIIGGAVGNVLDRLFRDPGWLRGGVVDFIDLQWWPIFNVADIAVTVGGALLLVSTLFAGRPARNGPE